MKKVSFALIAFILYGGLSFGQNVKNIEFSKVDTSLKGCEFVYSDYKSSRYLDSLRRDFNIDEVIKGCKTDFEKVLGLLEWTSNQWKHTGWNEPKRSDAISILLEVRKGQRFRCVEYGTVLAATLNSLGITARTIGLKTKNVETAKSGAGHVATEVYLNDLGKWIFVDPQYGLAPTLNSKPLNAVELNHALLNNSKDVKFISKKGEASKSDSKKYAKWIAPYLFYFDAIIDNRYIIGKYERIRCNGKRVLMLVPIGAKNPTIFQIKTELNWCTYTNSIDLFYSKPNIVK